MSDSIHGTVGSHEEAFSRLVAPRRLPYNDNALYEAATQMNLDDDPGDGKDAEENLYVPAGYTYLGQFVDHDLTLDTRSNLNPDDKTAPTNLRTPSLDLDCVYGNGPSDQPYLFAGDGATLRIGKTIDPPHLDDLARNTDATGQVDPQGRALIGDKRNDENSIVAQIQLAFIKFHNAVVAQLKAQHPSLSKGALFSAAQQEVRWTYQRMLVEDYLPRIVEAETLQAFKAAWTESGDAAYGLYHPELRSRIPIEFAGAAYRYGHSMVRVGYRMNTATALSVFDFSGEAASSLTGFQPLPSAHVIDDWGRFFPEPEKQALWPGVTVPVNPGPDQIKVAAGGRPVVRLQFAYKIDPSLTGPLGDLPARISDFDGGSKRPLPGGHHGPALSLLNLRRGNKFQLASGQSVAAALGSLGGDMTPADLKLRKKVTVGGQERWTFVDFPAELRGSTPLWLYVLAEAQRKIVRAWAAAPNNGQPVTEDWFLSGIGALTQLGPVGGRLVTETFFGLLDADAASYINAAPSTWVPLVLKDAHGHTKPGPLTFPRMLKWTGLTVSDGFGA